MLYPVELQAQSLACAVGRGRGIRTLDIQLPKLALYQAELYPVSPDFGHRDYPKETRMLRMAVSTVNCRGRNPLPCNKPHATETPPNKRVPQHPHVNGAPGRIRTSDHQVRSLVLYPAELRARTNLAFLAASDASLASPRRLVCTATRSGIIRIQGYLVNRFREIFLAAVVAAGRSRSYKLQPFPHHHKSPGRPPHSSLPAHCPALRTGAVAAP